MSSFITIHKAPSLSFKVSVLEAVGVGKGFRLSLLKAEVVKKKIILVV